VVHDAAGAIGAKGYPEKDFDLVAFFDCLHDMGDPAGAAAHVLQSLKPDGLCGLYDGLRAHLALTAGRDRTRRASR
jgi:SAM-dependent methyltransferase